VLLSRALILLPLGVAGARVGPEVRALPMDPDRAVFLEEDARQPSPVRFAEVQAVLADRCFACHGPDDRAREAGLRLDRREEALEVLAPGDPEASELVARILDDGVDRMPPRDSKLELSAAERDPARRTTQRGRARRPEARSSGPQALGPRRPHALPSPPECCPEHRALRAEQGGAILFALESTQREPPAPGGLSEDPGPPGPPTPGHP